MAIKEFPLELVDDNPYNPRKHYPQAKVKEMAQSLAETGLHQVPQGRSVDGRVQLAFGHMRLRGFRHNQKHNPYPENEKWNRMPVNIEEISDQDMFHFAVEENLRRTDITPLETARCIEAFSQMFPDVLDEDIAKKHSMTAANVSNMKRVLRLPEKILEKIDNGTISFTQGRELLIFEGFENAENLMVSAIGGLKIGNKYYGEPNTVEGLQKSIHSTISGHYRPLDKDWQGYRSDILFDTRAAGCLQCEKMVKTHPTKSATAHFCTDEKCWDRHQQEQRDKAAAEAKARMEAEIAKRVAEANISQEKPKPAVSNYTLEKRGTSWIALNDQGVIIAINTGKESADAKARASFEPVATKINPSSDEYLLNHTYRIIHKTHVENVPDVTAQDLATAIKAIGVMPEYAESVKVWKSSGKIGTGGSVSAGWSKCTESLDGVKIVEEELEAQADERDHKMEEAREKANLERPAGEIPCETCARGKTCDRSHFYADLDSDKLICDVWECDHVSWALPKEKKEVLVGADLMAKVEASYSGDRISGGQPLKKPFEFNGKQYINTGGTTEEWACYQLIDAEEFKGETRSYGVPKGREYDEYYESLRSDPMGFYHGMLVNGKTKVLVGPEITFKLKTNGKQVQTEVPTKEIPADVLEQAKKAAGTRAEVLDVHPLYSDDWRHELKGGYVLLNDVIREMDDPQECLERCVNGFHHAFDSGNLNRTGLAVCTDPKCVSKKKAALTRKENAEGQARKKAETKAIKTALANTTSIGRNELKVILLTQATGSHLPSYYGNESKKPEKWLWDKLSAGTPDLKRDIDLLFKKIDGLDDLQLARLVIEMMFYYLVDRGDLGKYKIKTELPLKWLGVDIQLETKNEILERKVM